MTSTWTLRAVGAPGGMVADAAELRRGLSILADPNQGCQIVALPSARQATLLGSDLDGLIASAEAMPSGAGVYVCLNPVRLDLGSKAKAVDVKSRRWLLMDIDPLKAAGFDKHSATDEEKEDAKKSAENVWEILKGHDWPDPMVIDSGNGWYLLYRINLPNDESSRAALRALLHGLRVLVADQPCSFDASVHNADRLAKLPGTWAKKGDPLPDRPHRPSRIVYAPTMMDVVTLEMIQAATPENKKKPTPVAKSKPTEPWTVRAGTHDNKRAYGLKALDSECVKLALWQAGDRDNQLYRSAATLGELAGAAALLPSEIESGLLDACRTNGLIEKRGEQHCRDNIRRGIEKGSQEPRVIPERNGTVHGTVYEQWNPQAGKETKKTRPVTYRLSELLTMELPDPKWAVPGLLSEGLTMLCGKPKLGKSWMALNLAMTIAAGGLALGKIRVQPAHVLYLALEDRLRRVQDRARKVMKGLGSEANDRLQFAVEWPRQDQLGVSFLAEWAQTISQMEQQPALIVIDVWAKFRAPSNARGNAYEQDYNQLSEVKSMGDHFGTSILAVHHTRKGAAEDVFDEVSGTQGIAGAADGTLILARSRGQSDGTLAMTGRDIEEQTLAVSFDVNTFCWTSHGSADEKLSGDMQTKIIAYLRERGVACFATDIAEHVERTADQIRPILHRLFDKKILRRVGNAWAYPAEEDI